MNCGIVGLPNVGKSSIFSALSSVAAEAENYPFCTIHPNLGMVAVPEPRLDRIHELIRAKRKTPASIRFVDIAGLVKGASKGEGLGNQFLSHIRNAGIIIHVVRCFKDENVVHVDGRMDPLSDIATVQTELALADLQTVENRLEKNSHRLKSDDARERREARDFQTLLERAARELNEGHPIRGVELSGEEQSRLEECHLITEKKQIYVCNVAEEDLLGTSAEEAAVRELAESEGCEVLTLCGKLEADIAALGEDEDGMEFLKEAGLEESGLNRLIHSAYRTLGLETFFTTTGEEENRAWTFKQGATASQCAGLVHSDFEQGFIKADVYRCEELFAAGSEVALRNSGTIRTEGRDYLVRDGDVMHFKFKI